MYKKNSPTDFLLRIKFLNGQKVYTLFETSRNRQGKNRQPHSQAQHTKLSPFISYPVKLFAQPVDEFQNYRIETRGKKSQGSTLISETPNAQAFSKVISVTSGKIPTRPG